jgi:O-antigen ligase
MTAVVSARRRRPAASSWPWVASPDRVAALVAVAIAVLAVPLAMGGRHPLGQCFLSVAAMAGATAWLLRWLHHDSAGWQLGPLDLLFTAGLAIGLVQLLPLSAGLVNAVSPKLATLFPCWTDGTWTLGRWNTLSLTPHETFMGIAIFASQAILVGCLFQTIDSVSDVERILRLVAISIGLMAALGIMQYLTSNGDYLWFYEFAFNDTHSVVKGTFSNRNNYASFLSIGVGSLAWWAFAPGTVDQQSSVRRRTPAGSRGAIRDCRRRSRPHHRKLSSSSLPTEYRLAIGLIALAVVAFAVLLSLSRGGALALAAAGLIATGMLLRAGRITPAVAGGMLGITLLLGAALSIHGLDRVNSRLDTIWEEVGAIFDDEQTAALGGRRAVWQAALTTIGDFPILGTGVGSHAAVSKTYMPPTDKIIFTHAENSYLNLGVETGLIGLVLAIVSLLLGFAACILVFRHGNDRERIVAMALTSGLAAGAVHAGTDFNWYAPACSTLLMLLGACAVKLALPHLPRLSLPTLPLDRVTAGGLTVITLAVLAFLGSYQLQAARAEVHFESAIKQSRDVAQTSLQALSRQATAARTQPPADASDEQPSEADVQLLLLAALTERLTALEQTVAARPDHPRAWAELAVNRLEHFGLARRVAGETSGLIEIRQTVESGQFDSAAQAQQWLEAVTGAGFADLQSAEQAALKAVAVNPCAGDAWCVLAALAFLHRPNPDLPRACIAQALKVRPHDGQVLFEAAVQAELDGDDDRAMQLRQQCFAECPSQRSRILNVLLPLMPATAACELLEPDLIGLRMIDGLWSRHTPAEQMQPVKQQRLDAVLAAAKASSGNDRCNLLYEAAGLQRTLGDPVLVEATLNEAIAANPNHYGVRLSHIDSALLIGDVDTAKRELDWCLLRRPDSKKLQERLRRLKQLRVEQANRPADLSGQLTSPGAHR